VPPPKLATGSSCAWDEGGSGLIFLESSFHICSQVASSDSRWPATGDGMASCLAGPDPASYNPFGVGLPLPGSCCYYTRQPRDRYAVAVCLQAPARGARAGVGVQPLPDGSLVETRLSKLLFLVGWRRRAEA